MSIEEPSSISDFDILLNQKLEKSAAQLEVEKHFPNLPSWVLRDYTYEEFLWLSGEEKQNLITYGSPRACLDPWTNWGG